MKPRLGGFCGREVFLSGEHEHGVVVFFVVVEMFNIDLMAKAKSV